MLLAVAGLDKDAVDARTRLLASNDWSQVHPAERIAFTLAREMSLTPWTLSSRDFRRLEDQFGRNRSIDVVWWSARCQYMTRVADAFQLPLERDNVFEAPPESAKPRKSDAPK